MKVSVKKYWIIINSLMIICAISLTLIISNAYLKTKFKEYTRMNEQEQSDILVEEVTMQYISHQNWNMNNLKKIALRALSDGYIVNLKENCGRVVWGNYSYNDAECKIILEDISIYLKNTFDDDKDLLNKKIYDIKNNNEVVASIEISQIKGGTYGANEMWFIKSLNSAIIVIGIFLLILFGVVVYYISVKMSRDLKAVSSAANEVSRGNLQIQLDLKSKIIEIDIIKESINNMASALREQGEIQKRVTADAAHELRTPLATLQSHMEAMLDGVWEPTNERIETCHKEILRIKRLIDDLWKLTKYESENIIVKKEKVNISDLLHEIKAISVKSEREKWYIQEGIYGEIDRDKLHQALLNIIENGHKYGADRVEIFLNDVEKGVNIRIKDNGIGMNEESLKHIFQRFYRGDKSRCANISGAGIGLTIAKRAIEMNGGTIEVNSEEGVGSEFIIRLKNNNY